MQHCVILSPFFVFKTLFISTKWRFKVLKEKKLSVFPRHNLIYVGNLSTNNASRELNRNNPRRYIRLM